jgi:alanine dehydrogenase
VLIGVPKEIKTHEYRVGLTPASVRGYVKHGHIVLVQSQAGAGIGASDAAYADAGAQIVDTAHEVFSRAGMIIKVKEPQPSEIPLLREHQILFTFLHLAADRAQALGLLDRGVTAVAYETVTDHHGSLPLLAPMSEVAGRLAIHAAATYLEKHSGGSGVLLGGVPGVAAGHVTVIGGGTVGMHAARMAVGLGAQVTVLDCSLPRLRQLDTLFCGRVALLYATSESLEKAVVAADAVIGAVLVPGASAPKLVTLATLTRMRAGSVVVDVAIDQGGCFETSRPTSHADPTYEAEGIVHYCVTNMPGAVPNTSSVALNNATLPFGLTIADGGVRAVLDDPGLRSGLNVHAGRITHRAVAQSLDIEYLDPRAIEL